MKPVLRTLPQLLRLVALTALLGAGVAHAEDYSDIIQLLKTGKAAEALVKADQRLAANSRDPQLRFLRGVAQADSGKQGEAITTFTKLTEEYPELPEPYNNLAVLYANQNQLTRPAPRWRWRSAPTPATPPRTKTWAISTPSWPARPTTRPFSWMPPAPTRSSPSWP